MAQSRAVISERLRYTATLTLGEQPGKEKPKISASEILFDLVPNSIA